MCTCTRVAVICAEGFAMVFSVVTDLEMAQQLLGGFCNEEVYAKRPAHEGLTCQEAVQYMLREEAKNMSKNGAYSSLHFN